MVLLPLFVVFCQLLFDFNFDDQYWIYVFIGGYDLGAVGFLIASNEYEQAASPVEQLPTQTAQDPKLLPSSQNTAFKYASWDDEEERR